MHISNLKHIYSGYKLQEHLDIIKRRMKFIDSFLSIYLYMENDEFSYLYRCQLNKQRTWQPLLIPFPATTSC